MSDEFLPYARPDLGDEEVGAVCDVLRSAWITSGPRVVEFEKAFARYVEAEHAVAVSSCTAGFHITLHALGIGSGDEVITPSLTWPAAVNMIHLAGARPVFADIDPATFELDPASVEDCVTPATRAVIPVHFGGQPVDLDRLRGLCETRNITLIEDAAHAVGARHRDRPIGSGKNPALFSFHAVKNLTTGEGGMVTTGSAELAERLRGLRFHGVDHDAWRRHGSSEPGGYDIESPGWKCNLTDVQAAIGLVQLERLESFIERRTLLAGCYDRRLSRIAGIERPEVSHYPTRHAWHLYTVLLDEESVSVPRDQFRARLRERNIGTGFHYQAVHLTRFYRERYPVEEGRLRHTESVTRRIVSLPLYPRMEEGDVERVARAIEQVLREEA